MDKITCIRKACEITDSVFEEMINAFKESEFKTENDVARFIKRKAKKNKVKLAFPTIVAAGRNAAEIHHKPTDAKLKGLIVIDFGFRYRGYCSDMTRTICIGSINHEKKKVYEKLLKVQKKSIEETKKGIMYKELDLKARKRLGKLKKKFKHALGHGVGSKIHQKPDVHPKSKHQAKTGDTITIEPGLYFGGRYGIRIEDTVLVKDKGCEVLTKSEKKLITIR